MDLKQLVTYSFARNVGSLDRTLRVSSGCALIAAGWVATMPGWATLALTAAGAGWAFTGVVGRCGVYYLLGYSTCPVGDRRSGRTIV